MRSRSIDLALVAVAAPEMSWRERLFMQRRLLQRNSNSAFAETVMSTSGLAWRLARHFLDDDDCDRPAD